MCETINNLQSTNKHKTNRDRQIDRQTDRQANNRQNMPLSFLFLARFQSIYNLLKDGALIYV